MATSYFKDLNTKFSSIVKFRISFKHKYLSTGKCTYVGHFIFFFFCGWQVFTYGSFPTSSHCVSGTLQAFLMLSHALIWGQRWKVENYHADQKHDQQQYHHHHNHHPHLSCWLLISGKLSRWSEGKLSHWSERKLSCRSETWSAPSRSPSSPFLLSSLSFQLGHSFLMYFLVSHLNKAGGSTLLFHISLISGLWNRNPNNNERNHLV